MWDFFSKLPLANLIVIAVFVLVVLFLLIGIFAPEIAKIAKERLSKNSESDVKLDEIKKLIETRIEDNDSLKVQIQAMKERQEYFEESITGTVKELVKSVNDGFRDIRKRLDNHIDAHPKIQPEYNGVERRKSPRDEG